MGSTDEIELYKKAFPDHISSAQADIQSDIKSVLNHAWRENQTLRVLCFGYGFGLTEAFLLRAIKSRLKGTDKKAEIYLVDTLSTRDLYGELMDRPRIAHSQ